MARDWFGRKTDTSGISGLDGYYDQPGGWRLWVRRIVGVIAILALLAAFIWAATWVYGSITDDNVDNGEEAGQVTSPGDSTIDEGAPGTDTDGTDGTSGSTGSNDDSTSTTDSSSSSGGTGAADSNSSTTTSEDSSMPRTGDDSTDTPVEPGDVLPATGG